MNLTYLLLSVAAGLAVALLYVAIQQTRASQSQSLKDLRDEMVAAAEYARQHRTVKQRFADALKQAGWHGPTSPLIWIGVFSFLLVAVALAAVGIGGIFGVVVAAPMTGLLGLMIATVTRTRRQRAFQRQLVGAFDNLAAKLRAGSSPSRAFEDLAPTLPEPLRSEVLRALDAHRSSVPLSEAMEAVARRYPSRPMTLFVTALRVGEQRGGAIAPAIEMSAATIREDFELRAEAQSEVAQERAQFYGIAGLIGFLAITTIGRSSPEAREAFFSPVGLIVLLIGVGNYALGVFLVLRKLGRIQKA